jgi:hypothetical protein
VKLSLKTTDFTLAGERRVGLVREARGSSTASRYPDGTRGLFMNWLAQPA